MIQFGLLLCLFSLSFQANVPANYANKSNSEIRLNSDATKTITDSLTNEFLEKLLTHYKDAMVNEFKQKLEDTLHNKMATSVVVNYDPSEKKSEIELKEDKSRLDKLLYKMVEEEKSESIENEFESATLRMLQLKSKLDKKIDDFTLALQALKNLRHHVDKVFNMTQIVSHNAGGFMPDSLKKTYLAQLKSVNLRAEKALNFTMTN